MHIAILRDEVTLCFGLLYIIPAAGNGVGEKAD